MTKIQQATKQINLRVPLPLLRRIDEARGDVPRERWIRRAIETMLQAGTDEGIKRISRPPTTRTEEFLRATQRKAR